MIERVPTGVDTLDELIEGGFPKGSLIVVAGNPGTGKSVFCMQFLCKGTELGENGVYISFAEGREALIASMSKHLGVDLKKLCDEGKLDILPMAAMRGDVATILEAVLGEVARMGAKRLVIDSFSTMAQALGRPADARAVLHTIIGKLIRKMDCTTLLVVETPIGTGRLGTGVEEFVADGVIALRMNYVEGRLIRVIEVLKMRGTRIAVPRAIFTLDGGFRAFLPKMWQHPQRFAPPLPNTPTHFSSGCERLDELLGGGFRRGSIHMYEVGEGVPDGIVWGLVGHTLYNFIANDGGAIVYPWMGYTASYLFGMIDKAMPEELSKKLQGGLMIAEVGMAGEERPGIIRLKGMELEEDFVELQEARRKLAELEPGARRPTLGVISLDTLINIYPHPEKLMRVANMAAIETSMNGDLDIVVCKAGFPEDLKRRFRDMATTHFKLVSIEGVFCLYGVKPRTNIHVLSFPVREEGVRATLTEIS